MKILSIQIGQPATHHTPDPNAQERGRHQAEEEPAWVSGIFKHTVSGPRFLGKTNLDGDGQADLKNHGGADKAICAYAHEHYAHWQSRFGLERFNMSEVPLGAFGENFTTSGMTESDLCIGDTFVVGAAQNGGGAAQEVTVQISQPRAPCWKLARRWQIGDLAEQVEQTGYTGWYFRVLQEGMVEAGATFYLIERPYPQFTLAEANRVMHHDTEDWQAIAALMQCPLLAVSWQKSLRYRINRYAPAIEKERIYGRT